MHAAQPTTFGHYLAGVSFELLRSESSLLDRAYDDLNRRPIGAAAGYGHSFPTRSPPGRRPLGSRIVETSLDAVASRDRRQVLHRACGASASR